MSDHAYATREVVEVAAGAVEAQRLARAIAVGELPPESAWTALCELQARHGRFNLPVQKAFVIELAKQVGVR